MNWKGEMRRKTNNDKKCEVSHSCFRGRESMPRISSLECQDFPYIILPEVG